jgi:hypothetical protein
MSSKPMTAPPPNAGTEVDDLLKAWFQALTAQPVPQALLQQLERLEASGGEA